jgi:hypothetical protein
MKRLVSVLMLAWAPALSSLADAHAFLDRANPAVGSVVRAAPAQVKLWFTQRLEPAFSTMQVLDAGGKRVDSGDAKVIGAESDLMQVSVPSLGPGTYRVTWRVLSIDTHVSQGDFTFEVAP